MPKRARPSKRQAKAQAPPREFTREELHWLNEELKQTPARTVRKGQFPACPPSGRGRKPDLGLLAAWIVWETARGSEPTWKAQEFQGRGWELLQTLQGPIFGKRTIWRLVSETASGSKPTYTDLAKTFYGRADCCLCKGVETVSFGEHGYSCKSCEAQYLLMSQTVQEGQKPGKRPRDLPKLCCFPPLALRFETALKLPWAETCQRVRKLKDGIRRLHRLTTKGRSRSGSSLSR